MPDPATLVFVYAADAGRWNAFVDTLHKLVSPSTYECTLCALTHGAFGPHDAWVKAVAALPLPTLFLHRDELAARYGAVDVALPAVLLDHDGRLEPFVDREAIRACRDLDALIALVAGKVATLAG